MIWKEKKKFESVISVYTVLFLSLFLSVDIVLSCIPVILVSLYLSYIQIQSAMRQDFMLDPQWNIKNFLSLS